MFSRSCGILLHITSLPGRYGIGDLGLEADRFLDFLAGAGQSWWQVLPLNPPGYGNSPYQCWSAFAGNPLLISPDLLIADGILRNSDLDDLLQDEGDALATGRVDFDRAGSFKWTILRRAFSRFQPDDEYLRFCEEEREWLEDAALFKALSDHYDGRPWTEWDEPLARREPNALLEAAETLHDSVEFQRFSQYLFFRQHARLRREGEKRGVRLIGDIPIFVAHNSADVWANQEFFFLDAKGNPTVVAGVPPDYFSKTGQRWGNPLYRWDVMAGNGYRWWLARLRAALRLYDAVRVDHFRGFEAYWEIPSSEKTAINGKWVPGPGEAFFEVVTNELGNPPILAEDLGIITPEVEGLRDRFGFPGMKVVQFGVGDSASPHLPHNFISPDCVVYTGTHDNDTTVGWWKALSRKEKGFIRAYSGKGMLGMKRRGDVADEMIRIAYASTARIAIVPVQDVLGLGSDSRMNVPGSTTNSNWSWRIADDQHPTNDDAERLASLSELYSRRVGTRLVVSLVINR